MPELPEVETVARQLDSALVGLKLRDLSIRDRKLAFRNRKVLKGLVVSNVFRSGKQVVISLSKSQRACASHFLAIHLRMTGSLVWKAKDYAVNSAAKKDAKESLYYRFQIGDDIYNQRHLRASLNLDGGELLFVDPRRFGTLCYSDSLAALSPKGLEPLGEKFSPQWLSQQLKSSKQEIKHWLLRQDKIVGIGNIYASEILFDAGIRPRRRGYLITQKEVEKLFTATVAVLKKAIKRGGTTFSDFQDIAGQTGSYQKLLRVYDREGEPCRRCKKQIKRIVQQGRSTFYCPGCQK